MPKRILTDLSSINTIDEAKKYTDTDYIKRALNDGEKAIFDRSDNLLKREKTDGTWEDDPNKIKDALLLLVNLIKAQNELENEKRLTNKNLTDEGNELLIDFLGAKKNNDISYQVIESKKSGEIDKIITDYQTLQYRRVNRGLEVEKAAAIAALSSIKTKIDEQNEAVEEAQKAYEKVSNESKRLEYKNVVEEAEKIKVKVDVIIEALKDDIDKTKVSHIGYDILRGAIDTQRKVADVIYRKNSSSLVPTTESWGSIIKTSVSDLYSDSQYAHPTYLGEGLPWQMRVLFEQFDKDKFFALIDEKFDSTEAKKIKISYERIVNAPVVPDANKFIPQDPDDGAEGDDYSMLGLSGREEGGVQKVLGYEPIEDSEVLFPKTEKEDREWNLFLTDVLYLMHAFFPKGSDFSNNKFLEAGNGALPFVDNINTLTTKHNIYWRGRQNDTLDGSAGYRDKFPGQRYPRPKAFPSKKLQLSWAGLKGESIPEFFWQVYDKPEAIQFNGFKNVLDKNGNNSRFFENDLSVYEEKLITWKVGSNIDPYLMAYKNRVIDIISGKIKIGSHAVEKFEENDPNSKGIDGEKIWTDFEKTCHKILTHVHRSFHEFRQVAENILYSDILASSDKKLVIPYMIENTKNDIDADIVKIWDELQQLYEGKIDKAKQLRAAWANEEDKRTRLNAQAVDQRRKLQSLENSYKVIEDGKFEQLKTQLERLGEKLKPFVIDSITHQEAMSIGSLHFLIKEHEGTNLDPKYDTYIRNLLIWETSRAGDMRNYVSWKKMGNNFAERLTKWKRNEGRNLDERAISAFFNTIKGDLEREEKSTGITPEEKADLVAINNYLDADKQPKLRATELEIIFGVDDAVTQALTDEWNNYGDEKKFKNDSKEVKNLVDMINNLSDKGPFFTELQTYLTGRSGVPVFPSDTATEQDKLNYYFTKLSPEYVIGAIAAYNVKNNNVIKKDDLLAEMKTKKDSDNKPLDVSTSGYGDGNDYTEVGIIRYYSEKLGGENFSFSQVDNPFSPQNIPSSPQEWYEWGYYAPIWGSVLVIGGAIIAYLKWDNISEWWNNPVEEKDDNEEEKEED